MGTLNQTTLADRLGITRQSVARLMRRSDWPLGKKRGGFTKADVVAIERWRAGMQENRASESDRVPGDLVQAAAQLKVLFLKERMETARLKKELLAELHVRRDLLDGSLGALASEFVQVFDEIEMSWPARFKGGIDVKELGRLLDSYRRRIASKAELELKSVQEVSRSVARRGRPTVN